MTGDTAIGRAQSGCEPRICEPRLHCQNLGAIARREGQVERHIRPGGAARLCVATDRGRHPGRHRAGGSYRDIARPGTALVLGRTERSPRTASQAEALVCVLHKRARLRPARTGSSKAKKCCENACLQWQVKRERGRMAVQGHDTAFPLISSGCCIWATPAAAYQFTTPGAIADLSAAVT